MPYSDIEEFAPHFARHNGAAGRASTSSPPETTSRPETASRPEMMPDLLFILLKGDPDGETLIAPYCETSV